MNRINKLTILLLSITGSVLLTGCSSSDKKLIQQNTASTFEYGAHKASYFGNDCWYGKYYQYQQNRHTKSEYDEQLIYGIGTYILEIASNKPTKLSFTRVSGFKNCHLKIINVACYPENSAKLTIDGNGDLQILPQNGHIKTKLFVEAENGLTQHFLAYFVNKKAKTVACWFDNNTSFMEGWKWFLAKTRDIDFETKWRIDENIQLRKDFIAFVNKLKTETEANPLLDRLVNVLNQEIKTLNNLNSRFNKTLAELPSENKANVKVFIKEYKNIIQQSKVRIQKLAEECQLQADFSTTFSPSTIKFLTKWLEEREEKERGSLAKKEKFELASPQELTQEQKKWRALL